MINLRIRKRTTALELRDTPRMSDFEPPAG
jgi:hypothetical protein